MRRRFLYAVVMASALGLSASETVALDLSGGSRFAVAEFARNISRCIGYYGVLGQGKDHQGNDATVYQRYQKLSEAIALTLMAEVKKFGIKPETILAWVEENTKQMGKDMNYDAINSAIIINKHEEYCKNYIENWREEWEKIKNSPKYK